MARRRTFRKAPRSVFGATLYAQRRSLPAWALGLAALGLFALLFYPAVVDLPEIDELLEDLPVGLQAFVGETDLTSPEGYLRSQLFVALVPLVLLIYAIGRGADAIAGEESRKTIDLLLSAPLARWRVVAEKALAMAAGLGIMSAAFLIVLLVGIGAVRMEVSLVRVLVATVGVALLGVLFGVLALAVGSITAARGKSIGIAAAVGVVSYLLDAFGAFVSWLEPARVASPFYHAVGVDPLRGGLALLNVGALVLPALVLLGVAVIAFSRRDVGV